MDPGPIYHSGSDLHSPHMLIIFTHSERFVYIKGGDLASFLWTHHAHVHIHGEVIILIVWSGLGVGRLGRAGSVRRPGERSWLTRRHRSVSSAFMKRNIRFIVIIFASVEMAMTVLNLSTVCSGITLIRCLKGLKSPKSRIVAILKWQSVTDWPRVGMELPGQQKPPCMLMMMMMMIVEVLMLIVIQYWKNPKSVKMSSANWTKVYQTQWWSRWRWWWRWWGGRHTHTHRPRLEAAGCGKNLTQGDQKPKTKDDDHNIDVYNVHTCSILTI